MVKVRDPNLSVDPGRRKLIIFPHVLSSDLHVNRGSTTIENGANLLGKVLSKPGQVMIKYDGGSHSMAVRNLIGFLYKH